MRKSYPIYCGIFTWLVLGCFLFTGLGCGKKRIEPHATKVEKPPGTAAKQPMSRAANLTAQAREALAQNHHQDALFFFNQALAEAQPNERAGVLSDIDAALNQIDADTIAEFLQIKELAIPNALLLFGLGRAHLKEQDAAKAVDVLGRFIKSYPDHPRVEEANQMLAAVKPETFKKDTIGCLLPLSGKYGVYGQKALQGIQLAVQELSGQYQKDFRTIIKDSASDPQKAALCVEELAKENVAGIVGPLLAVDTAGAKAQELGIPLIALTQKQAFPRAGDFLFSNFLTPQMQVQSLASHIFLELGLQKVAILYPDERYGRKYMELFMDAVGQFNGRVVGVSSYDGRKTDFGGPIRKLTGAGSSSSGRGAGRLKNRRRINFQALFIPDSPSRLNLLLPQLAYNDARGMVLLGTNIWHQTSLLKGESKYCRNAVITDGYFGGSQSPKTAAFEENYNRVYGTSPGFLEAVSYDTATILFTAAMDEGVGSHEDLKNALLGERLFEGATGVTKFDETGSARKQLFLITVKNGKFTEILH